MKEVLENNSTKPQHIFISAIIVNLVFFFLWKLIHLLEVDLQNVNYLLSLFNFIELATYYLSLYFLVWIERRIGNIVKLKLPVFGLILWESAIAIINYTYPPSTTPYRIIMLYMPGAILMIMLIYHLLNKKGKYCSEFKFIGISFLISKLVLVVSLPLKIYISDNFYLDSYIGSVIFEIVNWIVLMPKIAILAFMIKSLKENAEALSGAAESY